MDIEGPSTADGAYIQVWTHTFSANQKKWKFKRQSDGTYTIQSVYSGKYVSVAGTTAAEYAKIIQVSSPNSSNARWIIEKVASGYTLTPKSASDGDLALTVPRGTYANGTDLMLIYNTWHQSQLWTFRAVITEVPTSLVSNSSHLCIPCAITNVAGYWTTHGYSGFNATASQLEAKATAVHNYMNLYGSGSGAQANANIQLGLDLFQYTSNGQNHRLVRRAYSRGTFSWTTVLGELNVGKPFMLGFSGEGDSPYTPHMTVCVGYQFSDNKYYVWVSDAHSTNYRIHEFKPDVYNDNMFSVTVTVTSS